MLHNDDTRLIVVGSGVAGLAATLAAVEQGAEVLLVTAGTLPSGSSWWAQGGIAAAVGDDDDILLHEADTVAVGAGLNDAKAVEVLVEDGRRIVLDLFESGVPFDDDHGKPDMGLEAGHSRRRILHAGGGATGEMVSDALLSRVIRSGNVQILTQTPVDRLMVEGGRVVGVQSEESIYMGRAVILATGGYAGLWGRSTNPAGNRGFGLWLSWEAGASLADLEFVQFHPTALNIPGAPSYLLSEALRGDGALIVDAKGKQIVDPLLPRDVVARAVAMHLRERGPVYLTLRHLDPSVKEHFGAIAKQLETWHIDLARDLIPIAPAAHYCMGGVRTDVDGRTDMPGLYAAGEVACTGVQGANRLASNSLLECLVFGERAARAAVKDGRTAKADFSLRPVPESADLDAILPNSGTKLYPEEELGGRLDRDLGVARNAADLSGLAADLPDPLCRMPAGHLVASLATRAALLRAESRGAHYRTDATETLPEWRGRIMWRRGSVPHFEEVQ
ncbi:MAG: FAD-dependent oxidoreductase [Chloroflexota bacterium]